MAILQLSTQIERLVERREAMSNPRKFEASCASTMEALRDLFGVSRTWHGTQVTLVGELSRRSGLGESATRKVVVFLLGMGVLSKKAVVRAPRISVGSIQWTLEKPDAVIVKSDGNFRVQ